MSKYLQGRYTVKNPEKYVGDCSNVIYRSSWELKVLLFLDINPNILAFSSEETIVPYISPLDNKAHRYFLDFTVAFRKRDGTIVKALIEVKPKKQVAQPVRPKKMTKRFIKEVQTYSVNQAKWTAAKKWCDQKGFQFMILTEDDINGTA